MISRIGVPYDIYLDQVNLRQRPHDAGRTCARRKPAPGCDQRSRGDRTQESHHWVRMSCLTSVRLLKHEEVFAE